jgi:hypothetical protein
MKLEKAAAKRSRVHTRYRTKNDELVPGVTTVTGVLAKPNLYNWYNDLGLQGIVGSTYVDALALIGTIGHEMICCHNRGVPFDPKDYPKDLIDKAENCFLSYLTWEKQHKVEPILCEAPLVSDKYRYGGTVDMFARIDGVLTIVDYKTGKAIYPEHLYQVAAYRVLLEEHGYIGEAVRVLQIGRAENEGFSEKVIDDTKVEWQIFWHCLQVYRLRKIAA